MKVLRWDITVWWKPLVIWCRLAFWEETIFLAWFPYWLLTACWYLLFSLFSPTGSTLTTPQASEDPLKSKSPILMSRGSAPRFVVFASENRGPAWRNYPQQSLVSGRGGGYHSYFPPSPRSPRCPSSLFDLTIKSSPVFMSDVYPRAAWEIAGWRRRLRKCAWASYHLW